MSNRLFNDREFDRHFDNTEKLIKRGFVAAIIAWLIGICISLFVTGALIYVAWHFIAKYW